ncbi:hypothetical protein RHSIM_Rhsim02G0082000 [Rhododendron simsii]|uniref:DUF4220 domain-containing protein n=1 Tax=Rhododendron simsii TaxID=118357 RepID=A0A834HEC1_RHOSS|nr:hypothetical protein RHSIM_Rhsim02G0082000 [Rhododendron simsii]
MAEFEPLLFSLGLDFDLDSEPQTTVPKDPPFPGQPSSNLSFRLIEDDDDFKILDPPRTLKRLRRGPPFESSSVAAAMAQKWESVEMGYNNVDVEIKEFSSHEDRHQVESSVFSTLIVAKRRSLFQLFPESLARNWNLWEVRALVLFSFSLQVALVFCGSRRKYEYRIWLRAILWLAYQAANWATNFSLNVLSHGQEDCKTKSLDQHYKSMTIWAPLFLLHLCSPYTITAYSLEDNELWMRQLFGLSSSFGVAIYILYMSWTGSPLNYLSIPLLVAGMIKFGERIWVQYMASSIQFRDSMLPRPDPGPNYAKFMDAYSAKEAEGFKINRGPLIEIPREEDPVHTLAKTDISYDEILRQAYAFFMTFKRLFADLILSFQDYKESRSFFHKHSWEVAFKVVEVELGFVYDVLYTKAAMTYSRVSLFLRLLILFLSTSLFSAFFIIYWRDFPDIDMIITCSLLAGFNFLELYEVILLLSSDWATLWWGTHKNLIMMNLIDGIISFLRGWHLVPAKRKWSDHMAQYNLLSFCLKEKSATQCRVQKFFREKLEKYLYTFEAVSPELKELIFILLTEKSLSANNIKECQKLCAFRGGLVLEIMGCLDQLGWSINIEFDQSILLWHIATDLCYYQDLNANSSLVENLNCKISKMLSDYMLYLLVMCPFMLPNGIGQIRFQDTCAEAIEFLQEWKSIANVDETCAELLLVNTKVLPSEVKGDRSKSVLFDACRLAKDLRIMENEQKWKVVSRVWVEMLSYAASHCQWQHHARQLTNGGELLTHVSLLMAHLGLSEQFQISQGHGALAIHEILSKLGPTDTAAAGCLNTRFRDWVADESLWSKFCADELDLSSPQDPLGNPTPTFKGASEGEIKSLENSLKVKLPLPPRLLYRFCDGQDMKRDDVTGRILGSPLGLIGGYSFNDHLVNVYLLPLHTVIRKTLVIRKTRSTVLQRAFGRNSIIVASSSYRQKTFFFNCENGQLYVGTRNWLAIDGGAIPCVPKELIRLVPDFGGSQQQDAMLLWLEEHGHRLHSGVIRLHEEGKIRGINLFPEKAPHCSMAITNGVKVRILVLTHSPKRKENINERHILELIPVLHISINTFF